MAIAVAGLIGVQTASAVLPSISAAHLVASLPGHGQGDVVSSDNGRAALITSKGKIFLWREGVPGLRLVGTGTGVVAVSNDARTVAYDCGFLALCLRRLDSKGVRKVAEPCPTNGLFSTRELVSADLRSVLVYCNAGVVHSSSLLIRVGKHSTQITKLPGADAIGLSADGQTAVLEKHFQTYVYAQHRLRLIPGLGAPLVVSPNGRFIVGFGHSPSSASSFVVYDRANGQRQQWPPPSGTYSPNVGDRANAISDDGRLLIFTRPDPTSTPCTAIDYACAIELADLTSASNTPVTPPLGSNNTTVFFIGLSGDGTRVLYAIARWNRNSRGDSKPIGFSIYQCSVTK